MAHTARHGRPGLEERAESVKDWALVHSRELGIAVVALAAAAAGVWLFVQYRDSRATNASKSLMAAEQAYSSGNVPLAQRDLESVIARFDGTSAEHRARILLAHIHFDKREFERGISQLEVVAGSGEKSLVPGANGMIADGYEELGQFDKAAQYYTRAADAAGFPVLKSTFLTSAARAYVTAGKKAEAVKIWEGLAEDPSTPTAGEARVRLGELTAKPATRS
ncbi:MAG: tetratricopeptide repeat protein [Gemmatimonadaceae bacterium]